MADKQSPRMFVDVVSLATKKLDALCEQSRREKVAKVLKKRRSKWKERHATTEDPEDVGPRNQKDDLEDVLCDLKHELTVRRDEALAAAMRLQHEEGLHALEVFKHRLANENSMLQSYISSRRTGSLGVSGRNSSFSPDHSAIIKDLEATLSQAEAIAEIRKMKHTMTPRVPQLHNRTLSGNIFDQSLGILQDSVLDDGNELATELLDSEHAHLPIIGEEVSISQEESENFVSEEHRVPHQQEGGVEESDPRLDPAAVNSSPDKFTCAAADDPPGIGMEVVSSEVSDASAPLTMHPVVHHDTTSVVAFHNGMVNGFGSVSPPPPPPPHHEPHPPSLPDLHQSLSKGVEERLNAADLEEYRKVLREFEEAKRELCFPRYEASSSSSSSSNNNSILNPLPAPTGTSVRTPAALHTPSARKRGRPRKYPLQQPTPTTS